MDISVIIPVYNVEKYLEKCVNSVISQKTEATFEILLIDDGSKDSSGKICDELAMRYAEKIKCFHNQNGGLSFARNFGIDKASGEFITFLDSDDSISENFLQGLYAASIKNGADIACCSFEYIYENGNNSKRSKISEEKSEKIFTQKEAIDELILSKSVLIDKYISQMAWGKLYKKSLFEGLRFPEGKVHEDEFLTYKLVGKANKCVFVPNIFIYYLQRENSIMGIANRKNCDVSKYRTIKEYTLEKLEYFKGKNVYLNKIKENYLKIMLSAFAIETNPESIAFIKKELKSCDYKSDFKKIKYSKILFDINPKIYKFFSNKIIMRNRKSTT